MFNFLKPQKNNDPNLVQGKEFLFYEELSKRDVLPHLKLLETTSSPEWGSLVEALDSKESTKSKNSAKTTTVSNIENEFNKTLTEYTKTYKMLTEEMLLKSQTQQDVYKYYGKAITDQDGNFSYVNDYGFTHRYSTDAWINNDLSCPTAVTQINNEEDLSKLYASVDMGVGQACVAGQNVKNQKTGEAAWVDIKGIKHIYSKDIWDKKAPTCEVATINLDDTSYSAIPIGSPMTPTTVCDQLNINPKVWARLTKLNEKLLFLANSLADEINSLVTTDSKYKNEMNKQRKELNNYIDVLQKDRVGINGMSQKLIDITAEKENSELRIKSYSEHYLVYIILAVFMVALTLHAVFSSGSTPVASTVVLILCILIIYYCARWVYNKLF